jgi:hypothetical protein
MNKSAQKTLLAISILMLLAPMSGALAQTTSPKWNIQTVDKDVANDGTSLVLDKAGNPHISYYRDTDLAYARWTGATWHIQTVDLRGNYDYTPSLALDSSGNPHISYVGSAGLEYASWNGTAWKIQIIDSKGYVSSLALDSKGNPHIIYSIQKEYNADYGMAYNYTLMYASWTGSSWNLQTVDNGVGSSLALDSNGNPHISYSKNDALNYASLTSSGWDLQTIEPTKNGHMSISLVLDSIGRPLISFFGSGLELASWNGTNWGIQIIDYYGGSYNSLALDLNGNPNISFDGSPGLKYASWNGSTWNTQTVYKYEISGGMPPIYSESLALDSVGNPHISFTEGGLKYASFGISSPETFPIIITEIAIIMTIIFVVLAVLLMLRKKWVGKSKINS